MRSTPLLYSAIVLIAMDQASKTWVRSTLRAGRPKPLGPIPVRLVLNHRGAGGVLVSRPALVALWIGLLALLLAFSELAPPYQSLGTQVALGAAFGGATGSLVRGRF